MAVKVMREFRVGRFTCEMTFDQATNALNCAWSPRTPGRGDLTPKDLGEYKIGRNALMNEVAQKLGGNVLVVDV